MVAAYFADASFTRTNKPISSNSSGSTLITPRKILSRASGKFLPKDTAAFLATSPRAEI